MTQAKRHSLKSEKTGKFVSLKPSPSETGPQGFFNWLNIYKPRVLNSENQYEVWRPNRRQRRFIEKALKVDTAGCFVYSMLLVIQPRRHGKTTLIAIINLNFATSRKNETILLLGTMQEHTRRVLFNLYKKIIINTPKLRKLIDPEKDISSNEIRCPKTGSVIQMQTGVSKTQSFGEKITKIHASDLHAANDLDAWHALQASLLDSRNAQVYLDANVDTIGGVIDSLEKESRADPSIYCQRVEYKDLDHFNREAPPWISRSLAARLERTTLMADFKRDVLGQRSSSVNTLLPIDILDQCRDPYRCPVDDVKAMFGDRTVFIGGGLDRADSEWGSVFGNDNSVFTVVAMVADPKNQEPLIYVLDEHLFRPSTGKAIKKHILAMNKKYNFKMVSIEAHNTSDIHPYLVEQGIPCELVNPHSTTQNAAWPELVRKAKTGRLRISKDLAKLFSEMASMTYTKLGTGNYKFGAATQSLKDDRCYSLLWACYSLRKEVLTAYSLQNIQCLNKSKRRHLCFIMGGNLELLCGEQCAAYQQVKEMYLQFLQYQTESTLTLAEWFHLYVKIQGAVIYQAA